MAKKNKLQKFADILSFPNVIESYDMKSDLLTLNLGDQKLMAGKWNDEFFKNDHPICLELACGKGDYALALSQLNPQINYLGVDIKGNRIWKGAQRALNEDIKNVGFLRTRIERLDTFFQHEEVKEIWITFPDPFPKKSKVNRRLTSHYFLDIYKKVLPKGAFVHLKTDARSLYEFTLESIDTHPDYSFDLVIEDVYAEKEITPELEIKTFYEKGHLEAGKMISYLRMKLL